MKEKIKNLLVYIFEAGLDEDSHHNGMYYEEVSLSDLKFKT